MATNPQNVFAPYIRGTGLSIAVSGGTIVNGAGNVVLVPLSIISLQANGTNFVYLDMSTGNLVANTSGFPGGNIYPIAIVTTKTDRVNVLADARPDVFSNVFSGGASFNSAAVAFNATPTFNATSVASQLFKMTLTGNVTSSTLAGATAGQIITFEITQDGTGNRTFVWPVNVVNPMVIDGTANAINVQSFIYDGTNATPISAGTSN